ncbi:hypothetical protein BKI52_24075 [marine bacterium AO1-C]|nr:hypothetical protein BKI52_24075 [marine bacterium AO1-C]
MQALSKTFNQIFKIPNKALDWLIFHNFYISLGAVVLTFTSFVLLGVPINEVDWALLIFIFCATIFTYNIDRVPFYFDRWFPITLQTLATVGIIICSFWFSWTLRFFLIHLGFIAVFYSIPKGLGWVSWFSLRRIPLLKIFLVAYGWAAVTVILPVISLQADWQTNQIFYLFVERFLFIFIITIPFDIGDFKNDQLKGIITLPVWMGIKNTRWLGFGLVALFLLITIGYQSNLQFILSATLLMAACCVFLVQVNVQTSRMYYKKYVDGSMFLYFALFSLA